MKNVFIVLRLFILTNYSSPLHNLPLPLPPPTLGIDEDQERVSTWEGADLKTRDGKTDSAGFVWSLQQPKVPPAAGGRTCSACPSPGENLKV